MPCMDPEADDALANSHAADAPVPVALDWVAHALLGGFRAHAVGHGDCGLIHQRLAELCGPLDQEMSAALLQVVRLLALRSQRRLQVHLPQCRGLSRDEMLWLAAVAEAQSTPPAQRPAPTRMGELAGVFDPALEWAAANVAQILLRGGRRLTLPPQMTARALSRLDGAPASATIH